MTRAVIITRTGITAAALCTTGRVGCIMTITSSPEEVARVDMGTRILRLGAVSHTVLSVTEVSQAEVVRVLPVAEVLKEGGVNGCTICCGERYSWYAGVER